MGGQRCASDILSKRIRGVTKTDYSVCEVLFAPTSCGRTWKQAGTALAPPSLPPSPPTHPPFPHPSVQSRPALLGRRGAEGCDDDDRITRHVQGLSLGPREHILNVAGRERVQGGHRGHGRLCHVYGEPQSDAATVGRRRATGFFRQKTSENKCWPLTRIPFTSPFARRFHLRPLCDCAAYAVHFGTLSPQSFP